MRLAFLFPGQGSQAVGMGRALAEAYPAARETFATADAVLGEGFSRLCWEGPEDELKMTLNAQPALLTHSIAAHRLLSAAGVQPEIVAGHSLGEYSALVAAGSLRFEHALQLVRRRGELMYQAGIDRPGAMAAILGLSADEVAAACNDASGSGVAVPANLNAPGQIVISGDPAAVDAACENAKTRGARRAIRLEVSGAFHSPLMGPAAEGLARAIDETPVEAARVPVIANVSARPVQQPDEIRAALKAQLLGAVRWEETLRGMLNTGVEGFVEVGTGKVLRGLLRTLDKQAASWNVEDPESLNGTLEALGVGRVGAAGA